MSEIIPELLRQITALQAKCDVSEKDLQTEKHLHFQCQMHCLSLIKIEEQLDKAIETEKLLDIAAAIISKLPQGQRR